jgi:hypothetical protein
MVIGGGYFGVCLARPWYLDRKETHVSEYTPFLVIGIFGVALFLGTIIWTERLFPENKKKTPIPKQEELDFPKQERNELVSSSH